MKWTIAFMWRGEPHTEVYCAEGETVEDAARSIVEKNSYLAEAYVVAAVEGHVRMWVHDANRREPFAVEPCG